MKLQSTTFPIKVYLFSFSRYRKGGYLVGGSLNGCCCLKVGSQEKLLPVAHTIPTSYMQKVVFPHVFLGLSSSSCTPQNNHTCSLCLSFRMLEHSVSQLTLFLCCFALKCSHPTQADKGGGVQHQILHGNGEERGGFLQCTQVVLFSWKLHAACLLQIHGSSKRQKKTEWCWGRGLIIKIFLGLLYLILYNICILQSPERLFNVGM